ncbi:hypothetical protein DFJ63DRAFT_148559 [Scheffersomyces coipomensis]|uniref:uncharacterized protein n=1 Tax=Scheffersomyces coipomensis TaxID=1788519 RepID=UPI00315DE2E5
MLDRPYNRKVNNYQTRKLEVCKKYIDMRDEVKLEDDITHDLEDGFDALMQYDEILYEYKILRGYLQDKSDILTSEDRILLSEMESTLNGIEKVLPLSFLISRIQELALVRRNLFENAMEAPKLLNQFESSIPTMEKFIEPPKIVHSTLAIKPKPLTPFTDSTWSAAHVKVVYDSVLKFRTNVDRCVYIKQKFEDKFQVNISTKVASYFLLHYGFRDTGCKLELFNKTMTEGYALNRNIPTKDRVDRMLQYFMSELNLEVTKNDLDQGSKFRRVLMNTYYKFEEPEENYVEVLKHAPYLNEQLIPLKPFR